MHNASSVPERVMIGGDIRVVAEIVVNGGTTPLQHVLGRPLSRCRPSGVATRLLWVWASMMHLQLVSGASLEFWVRNCVGESRVVIRVSDLCERERFLDIALRTGGDGLKQVGIARVCGDHRDGDCGKRGCAWIFRSGNEPVDHGHMHIAQDKESDSPRPASASSVARASLPSAAVRISAVSSPA